ncbi:MAG: hypothetical protein F4139_10300 [Gemmatimonadetes bacterium]|nr:hypothetical protein [Gemmatimonadota bacterium]MYA64941.1 hypothetical protein [Gemmatimonadota bacterium]MYB97632.1 hypothetical protein [Gemmatimonadota bacterium]MYH53326.1 hypothetical protein [Gemmatimonadota bacterium]MYI45954.1 hypothetical protein [Gemmatimonadota bacterium]
MKVRNSLTSLMLAATAVLATLTVVTPAAAQMTLSPLAGTGHSESALVPMDGSNLPTEWIAPPTVVALAVGDLSCSELAADSELSEAGCLGLLGDIASAFARCFSCWMAVLNPNPGTIAKCALCIATKLIGDEDVADNFQECIEQIKAWIDEHLAGN